jgi:hypothetical protein
MEIIKHIKDKKEKIKLELLKLGIAAFDKGQTECEVIPSKNLPDFSIEMCNDAIHELENEGFVTYVHQGLNPDYFRYIISDLGMLEIENDNHNKSYTTKILTFLNYVAQFGGWKALSNPEIQQLLNLNESKIHLFMQAIRISVEINGGMGGCYILEDGRKNITSFGEYLLQQQYEDSRLFNKPFLQDKSLILDAYHEIEEAVNNQRWKSAFIHMTAILEYCITDWGIHYNDSFSVTNNQGRTQKYLFSDTITPLWAKLRYVIDVGCDLYLNIGAKNDWMIVDTIFRLYRNFIHLKALEQSNQPIEMHHYQSLRAIFDKLIKYF